MTAIYKTGTVSVNNGSNIVTGNGTSFIDVANVQEGDLFTVDGQKFYEAYEVDTNTQIKIRNIVTGGAFAETNVTAGNFAIIRNFTSQTSAEIAGKVLAVQQKWMNREEEMTDWFYTADNWADVTSINGDQLTVMTPNGINNLLGTAADKDVVENATDTVTGRILNVGAGGLLNSGNAPSILPDNTLYPSMLGRDGDGAGGYPVFGWASTILNMRYNNTRQSQIGVSHSAGVANIAFRTMVSDNLWTDKYNLFGEHNSKNPLEQGVGSDNLYGDNLTADLQDTGVNGNTGFFAYGPSCLDIPVASSYGMVMNLNYQTGSNAGAQLVLVTSPNNRMLFRSGGIDTAPWSEVYHSNNLNPNSFGLAANDLVGKGSAASATVAVFELPLVSTKAPTSLSVTGTFKIKNPASGSDLITGISAATIANALNSSSSDRWAYIVLSGLTGLTFNHALHLVGETADANIKVNF